MLERAAAFKTSAHMQPLARLPVFFALEGRRVVIAGGNAAAAWKAELLSAAGGNVDVYAIVISEELAAIAANPPRGAIVIHRRCVQAADLSGAAMLIGACETDREARALHALARAAGVPINVIDKPEFCDFSFGAIVNRSPLVIGISTDGAAPVFAQAIRAKIEALVPAGFARWMEAALQWRRRVAALGLDFLARRRLWEAFTTKAILDPDRAPGKADLDALLADVDQTTDGSVTVVDASVNDPELLTLRAVRQLQSADVVVADECVSPAILDFARREANKLTVVPGARRESDLSGDTDALMTKLAKGGKRVLRLVVRNKLRDAAQTIAQS
jgi:uroporphyrin-III C-methyltransferase / precorrin-2 dehydrogenase / sirohydrochlorin ferrochelatase